MQLILKIIFRVKSHFLLFLFTVFTLLLFTFANQIEVVSLGVIMNTGSDFFALFDEKKSSVVLGEEQKITLDHVQKEWSAIAGSENAPITKTKAAEYLASNEKNLLNKVLQNFRMKFHLQGNKLEAIVLLLIFVAVFKAAFLFLSRYTTQLLSIRISKDLRQQYFEHIQKLPMTFYQQYNIGSLSSRVAGDAAQIAASINSCITNYVHTPFTIITTLFVCFYVSWKLSLVIFIGLPSIILPVAIITKKVKHITRQFLKNQEDFTSILIDFLAGIQTVKIFSMEAFSLRKYQEKNDQMAFLQKKTAKYDLMVRPILHTITTFCLAFVVISGLYFFHMSVSDLVVFCGFLHMFYEPVKKFADENTNIQKGVVAAERLFEVLRIPPQMDQKENLKELTEFNAKIEFQDVWFRYEDRWVLRGVSFTIKKGETVAIVGATGSGKSTILQLLPRLYEIEKGDIKIDGVSLKAYSQASLRNFMSYVSQKPFLFFDTIRANITYGRPIPHEEVLLASKKAHAHEFIQKLPDGYDTHLAETGKNLSGGQQQRLSIARALAKKSPILILDEATSSLDAISEDKIKTTIRELHGEITQIIVAHRFSTIEDADRIIFIQEGQKIADGSKEELLKSCPPFKLMWDLNYHHKQLDPEEIYT